MQAAAWVSPPWHPCSSSADGAAACSRSTAVNCTAAICRPLNSRVSRVCQSDVTATSTKLTHGSGAVQRFVHLARALAALHSVLQGARVMGKAGTSGRHIHHNGRLTAPWLHSILQGTRDMATWQLISRSVHRMESLSVHLTLPFIFFRSFLASERCHLGSQRSGSGGGPGLAGSKLQRLRDECQLRGC